MRRQIVVMDVDSAREEILEIESSTDGCLCIVKKLSGGL